MQEDIWSAMNHAYLTQNINAVMQRLEWYHQSVVLQKDLPYVCTANENAFKFADANNPALPAIEKLVKKLSLSSFERDVLLMCAGVELDAAFASLTASLQGENEMALPTFALALAALENAHWDAVSPAGPLRYWQLVDTVKSSSVTRSAIKINEHILHYITGVTLLHERLMGMVEALNADHILAPSQLAKAAEIVEALKAGSGSTVPLIRLSGNDLPGIEAVARYVSDQLHLQLFMMPAYAVPVNINEASEIARLWNREALLNDYALIINCADIDLSDKTSLHALKGFIRQLKGLVILNTEHSIIDYGRLSYVYHIEKPTAAEQLHLWKKLSGSSVDPLHLQKIISQFNLGADSIYKINTQIFAQNAEEEKMINGQLQKKLWTACCRQTRPQLDDLAERIKPVAGWNDIVLPDEQSNRLREIAAQVKQRSKVHHDWGFADQSSRGLGISALFAGESGTGKTMASEVLANDLQLDLYKIDLSKVVNKYIGETEKNLKKIFDAAEDGGAILLFDEADALFGKRSEVKDSHDRYSNIEVSYLLQRMEAYHGLAILTTNMKSALDKAFMRRIRFVVQFPFPDAAQRAEIW